MSGQLARTSVLLVFGGVSSEHQVSCLTAGGVARAIDPERFNSLEGSTDSEAMFHLAMTFGLERRP